jgi:subtilisin family serine protease
MITSRRDFLLSIAAVAAQPLSAKASDEICIGDTSTSIQPCPVDPPCGSFSTAGWQHNDGSNQSGISISVHPSYGGHYSESVMVTLTPNGGTTTALFRGIGEQLFFQYIPAGQYRVCVAPSDADLASQCIDVTVKDCKILMLPVYLGEKSLPMMRIGRATMPFSPASEVIAIIVSRGWWVGSVPGNYLEELKRIGLLPFPDEKSSISRGGTVFYLTRALNADGAALPLPVDFLAKLEKIFPAKNFGGLRVGIPLNLKPKVTPSQSSARVLDNQYLVRINKEKISREEFESQIKEFGTISEIPGFKNTYRLIFTDLFNYRIHNEKIEALLKSGLLTTAEPDLLFELENHAPITPSDPWFQCQQYIQEQRIDQAWALGANGYGLSTVVVTTIDDGVNRSTTDGHSDLNRNDVVCVDLSQSTTTTGDLCETPLADASPHGMGVYGIIAAKHNSHGIAGIAPNTKHVAIRRSGLSIAGYAAMLKWAGGISGAVPINSTDDAIIGVPNIDPASVINCSHGMPWLPLPTEIEDALCLLATEGRGGKGTIVVYSADKAQGPPGPPALPPAGGDVQGTVFAAMSPHTIIVGNTARITCDDNREVHDPTANIGWRLNVCAYGGLPNRQVGANVFSVGGRSLHRNNSGFEITSPGHCQPLETLPGSTVPTPKPPVGVWTMSETSAAAAMVSGVVALILSANPNLSLAKVRKILHISCKKIDSTTAPVSCSQPYYSVQNPIGTWKKMTPSGWEPVSAFTGTDLPVGLNHRSNWYGYGRLDAHLAVTLATLAVSLP